MSRETYSRRVEVMRFKLNNQLATYVQGDRSMSLTQRISSHYTSNMPRWRPRVRLYEKHVAAILRLYKAGASKPELAAEFKNWHRQSEKVVAGTWSEEEVTV